MYLGLVLLAAGYPLLAQGRLDSRARAGYFVAGLLTLWAGLETPIDTLSDCCLQSVHMGQHVLLGIVAPPLLVLGLSPAMARSLVRRLPPLRAVTEPVPGQLLAALVMIAWHLPPLYDLTVREPVHIFEHLTFIAAGVCFWWPVVGSTGEQARWRLGDGGRIVYLLIGTLPQDGVALPLIFSRAPFYAFYEHAPRLVEALTPIVDQNLAGSLLMFAGKTSYLLALLVVFARWVSRDRREGAISA